MRPGVLGELGALSFPLCYVILLPHPEASASGWGKLPYVSGLFESAKGLTKE